MNPSKEQTALIVFAREPLIGDVKTRLQKDFSSQDVLTLYKAFIQDVLLMGSKVRCDNCLIYKACGRADADKENLNVERPVREAASFFQSYQKLYQIYSQVEGDLGERMFAAVSEARHAGAVKIVLIGTDCLTLTSEDIQEAFHALNKYECVLGPSHDGGFYLIGMRELDQNLFSGVGWGGKDVFAQTMSNAEDLGWQVGRLRVQDDIDTGADVRKFAKMVVHQEYAPYTKAVLKTLPISG